MPSVGKGVLALLPPAMLIAALGVACLPEPEEPVDFLPREDAVIIQMLTVSGEGHPEIVARLTVPDFTLYGDGTLIVRSDGSGGRQLLRARLPEEALRDLLEPIVDEDFLDFPYAPPQPGAPDGSTTTYLYVNTTAGVNSARASALGDASLQDGGDEFEAFRRLKEIKRRLDELDPEAAGGSIEGEFLSESVLLVVQRGGGDEVVGSPAIWPLSDIADLEAITSSGNGIGEAFVEGDAVEELRLLVPNAGQPLTFQQGGVAFRVGYRPALPFEENFPEFDFP